MRVEVRLLGGFAVVIDGQPTPAARWSGRRSSALVKLLALAPGRRLHRDRVIDALWPEVSLEAALPRLHKAAHFARAAIDQRAAIVLRDELVLLLPEVEVQVDAVAFEAAALAALAERPISPDRCAGVLDGAAELLPDDINVPWLAEPRTRLRLVSAQLARAARLWDAVLRAEPADEEAHVELIRADLARGDRSAALRRYAGLSTLLETELGVRPGAEAQELHQQAVSMPPRATVRNTVLRPPPPVLVERDGELDDMTAIVRSTVSERRGVVILVAGEAGAGKSALVRALLARMDDEVSAFVGGCDDLLAPRSLGPFRDMAEAHPVLAPAMATTRIDEALPALLRAVSAQPSIVVVEDLHWADDATYDAIRFLARRLRDKPVALILTYRDEVEPDHPLRQVLGGLAGLPVQRVPLEPLSADGVRCLGAASAAEAHDLIQITGGNPFFVTEFLATRGLGVPVTVRDAVLARMGRLAPPVRVLLRRLSVVPTRAARTLAEQLAGGRHSVVVEAERSGVVVGGADWVAFRHELARQAIETSLLPGERIEANTLVVEALLDDPDVEPARVVHHAVRSRRTDLILQFGPRAAEEASRLGAHRQAAEVLRVVLQHSTAGSPADRADLATRLAYSLYVVNRYEESLGYAEAAVRAAETANDTIALADALLVLSRVVLFARGPSRARAAAARAVELLRAAQDEARLAAALTELARAHSNLPTVGIVAEPCEESAKLSEQALELARNLRRPDVTAQALCYRGDARLAAGDQRGADDQRQAIALASADSRLETRVRAHVNAAGGAFRCGRFEDALRYVDDGLRLAADGEFFAGQYRLRLTAATVHASQGDWDTAATELRTLIETPGEPGVMAALARSVLARLLARRGDADAAAVLAAAVANPAFGDDALVTGVVTVAGIELGWLDGTLGELTPLARQAIVMTEGRYTAVHAELCGYLARAGVTAPGPLHPPGPWAPTLTDRWREASAAWAAIGERYEHAVVLATAPDRVERSRGLELLGALGAVATIAAL